MNPKYLNAKFAEQYLVKYPLLTEWRRLEFFVLGDFIIRTRKHGDKKYRDILLVLAETEISLPREEAIKFVTNYLALISEEYEEFLSFTSKNKLFSSLLNAIRIYREYGSPGVRVLSERKFVPRIVVQLDKLFALHGNTTFQHSERLVAKLGFLGAHQFFAECGILLVRKRSYFGANLGKEHLFFIWVLSLALDPEDYASKYVSTKSEDDLERVFLTFVRKSGGVHQSMVKLTRDVRSGLRRFD